MSIPWRAAERRSRAAVHLGLEMEGPSYASPKPLSAKPLPPKPPVRAATVQAAAQVRAQVSDRSSLLGAIQAGKALKKVEMKEVNWVMCVTMCLVPRNCGLEPGNLGMRLNFQFCADLFISYRNFSISAPDIPFHLRASSSIHLLYDLTMVLQLHVGLVH